MAKMIVLEEFTNKQKKKNKPVINGFIFSLVFNRKIDAVREAFLYDVNVH